MSVIKKDIYQYLLIATILLLSSCGTGKKISGDKGANVKETIQIGKETREHQRIIEEALTWVGTPYKYAGMEKGKGVDCSGMVMQIYLEIEGIKLPRNSAKQAEFCNRISADEVAMGDLVFFATGRDSKKVSHVGIMMDNEKFIHASSSKGVVISNIKSPYYQRTFRMFGRIPETCYL